MSDAPGSAPLRPETGPATRPRASIVIEWENALHSAASRSEAMLRELRRQAERVAADDAGAGTEFELLVVHDAEAFDAAALRDRIAACVGSPDAVLDWRLLPAVGGGYYRSKDFGAQAASGDTLLFLDSDVIPEPKWLARMLSALEDPGVRVVAGSAYIEPSGLVGKVFALTWFFPLRSTDGPLRRVGHFFANNLAVRRDVYLAHPFPDLQGTARGACLVLADQLKEAGISIHQHPRARVTHPAPNGFRHISKRALAQGRDRLYRERNFGTRWSASWPGSCVRWVMHLGGASLKLVTRFRRVGLNPLAIPAALAVAWYYYTLYWVGETLSHLRVPAVRRIRV